MSLIDTRGRPLVADHAEPAVAMGEVATSADGRDITRGYVDALPLLGPSDYILLGRAGGNYQVYEQIATDAQVKSCLTQRKKALVSKEWEVVPGRRRGQYSKAKARQAAESLSAMLEDLGGESESDDGEQAQPMPGFDAISEAMLHGIFPGFAAAECLWQQDGREIVLDRVAVRRSRRFGFAPTGALRLMTSAQPDGEVLPRRKFWTYTYHHDATDDPYGLGEAHWCYWPVYFKRADVRVWMLRLDKLGLPTVIGEFDPAVHKAPDQAKLLAAVRAVRTDTGLIIPQGMVMRLLEAAAGGAVDNDRLHQVLNADISKVLLGHSAAADSTPGRLGGEDRSNDVADAVTKADADLVCGSFNVGPARWLTAWNFGDAVPAPKVWRRVEAEQDLKPLAERDQIIVDMAAAAGQRLTAAYLTATYGVELEAIEQAPPPGQPGPADAPDAGTSAAFADGGIDAQDQIDAEGAGDPGYQAAMELLLAPILAALDDGMSPEDILARLPQWYGQMDDAALVALLEQGVAAADAIGRLEVQTEAAG